jgi:hypothetical protein
MKKVVLLTVLFLSLFSNVAFADKGKPLSIFSSTTVSENVQDIEINATATPNPMAGFTLFCDLIGTPWEYCMYIPKL